jgi:CBS domain-containing membrane protein
MYTIADIMTKDVFTLHATQTLALARFLMNLKHVRHIPIVEDDNRFVGLLTHRDLLAYTISIIADPEQNDQEEMDLYIHIIKVMKTKVITAGPGMALRDAIPILLENKYGCLPVVSDEKLVGIVTEADFLRLTLKLLQREGKKQIAQ